MPLRRWLKLALTWSGLFLFRRAIATWPGAKGNWKNGLSQPMSWMYIVWAVVLTWVLVPAGFELGFLPGMSFLGTAFSAWYFGYIFRDELAMIYVYLGVIFGGAAQGLLGDAFQASLAGQFLPALVLVIVVAYLWIWSERMKKSDFDWEPRWAARFKKEYRKRK